METETALTVGTVASLAGVTVRTLHHYDEIGLVAPAEHSSAGYRLYSRRDIERLQEVLFFRELGIGLAEIRRIVEETGYRRDEALGIQRELLLSRSSRLLVMVEAIDRSINAAQKGINMTTEEILDVFGDFDPAGHQAEVNERWGDTDAYEESNRRVSSYKKHDWLQLRSEADALDQRLLVLMTNGIAADSIEAMDVAEEHRVHITKWFYNCTPEIHAGLGHMYIADSRFRDSIDKAEDGLAQYLSEAIAANHQRLGSTPENSPDE
ncbi:MAG: MerR family transcriptional regulator [Actinomycetia bacterium]|nr:MerR family transcriptional regulator [Actinomycetes bacterium]